MTHLDREELERFWRDPHSPARARVVAHLAECDACGALYGDIMDAQPQPLMPVPEPEWRRASLARRSAGRAKAAALRLLREPPSWLGWRAWHTALAAAAVVVLIAGFYGWRRPESGPAIDETVRGAVQLLSPVGDAREPVRFRWASAIGAARYQVEIRDEAGAVVTTLTSTAESVDASASAIRLTPGVRYTWRVAAVDEQGGVLTQSDPRSFVVSRD